MADGRDLGLGQLHHVLHTVASVDKANRVVLKSERGEGGELLLGRFLIGGFVGESG